MEKGKRIIKKEEKLNIRKPRKQKDIRIGQSVLQKRRLQNRTVEEVTKKEKRSNNCMLTI